MCIRDSGYPITDDRSEYDKLNPYSNRDPRLDLYIIHDGSTYKGKTIHTAITTANNNDGLNKISNYTRTGYYMKKLLREDCNPDPNAKNPQYHYPVYILSLIHICNFNTKHYWFPLPIKETQLYPEFNQNPGW